MNSPDDHIRLLKLLSQRERQCRIEYRAYGGWLALLTPLRWFTVSGGIVLSALAGATVFSQPEILGERCLFTLASLPWSRRFSRDYMPPSTAMPIRQNVIVSSNFTKVLKRGIRLLTLFHHLRFRNVSRNWRASSRRQNFRPRHPPQHTFANERSAD